MEPKRIDRVASEQTELRASRHTCEIRNKGRTNRICVGTCITTSYHIAGESRPVAYRVLGFWRRRPDLNRDGGFADSAQFSILLVGLVFWSRAFTIPAQRWFGTVRPISFSDKYGIDFSITTPRRCRRRGQLPMDDPANILRPSFVVIADALPTCGRSWPCIQPRSPYRPA